MYWKSVDIKLPECGREVIGYSKNWIDEDFNPRGERVCFYNYGVGWTCAKWVDSGDSYITLSEEDGDDAVPTDWMPLPESPEK